MKEELPEGALPGGEIDVLNLAGLLHMNRWGAADLLVEDRGRALRVIKARLKHWTPTRRAASKEYDDAVKNLLLAVVAECDGDPC